MSLSLLTFGLLVSCLCIKLVCKSIQKAGGVGAWGFFPLEFVIERYSAMFINLSLIIGKTWLPTEPWPILTLLCCFEDSESPRHFIPADYLESTEEFIRRRHDDKEVTLLSSPCCSCSGRKKKNKKTKDLNFPDTYQKGDVQ